MGDSFKYDACIFSCFMVRNFHSSSPRKTGSSRVIKKSKTLLRLSLLNASFPLNFSIESPQELVDLIFERPYCRIQYVTDRKLAGRQTASVYLKQLVRAGVLEEKAIGREKLFIHPKLVQLLTRDANSFEPYT